MNASHPGHTSAKSNKIFYTSVLGVFAVVGAIKYVADDIKSNPKGTLATAYKGSFLESTIGSLLKSTIGRANQMFAPVSDKLMPDWPTAKCYKDVAPGTPCPPLLIVDLERTLVGSVHDYQFGWRHVKRPGLDKFIKTLSQYYEIVIFSENDIGVAQEIMDAIDPDNMTHRMGSSAAEIRGTKVLKRLEYMNRDPRKILVIDDNPESVELCQDNAIIVKPFTDVNGKTDRELENLIPLLQAFVHDGVQDYPKALRDLGTHEAEEAVAEYRMRLEEVKRTEQQKRNFGLGGLIRGAASAVSEDDGFTPRSAILSPAAIVGSTAAEVEYQTNLARAEGDRDLKKNHFNKDKPKPAEEKKKGWLLEQLEKKEEMAAQEMQLRYEKMNEIHRNRLIAKQRAAAGDRGSEE
jgi:import inner membrane translocase subunit TIM50